MVEVESIKTSQGHTCSQLHAIFFPSSESVCNHGMLCIVYSLQTKHLDTFWSSWTRILFVAWKVESYGQWEVTESVCNHGILYIVYSLQTKHLDTFWSSWTRILFVVWKAESYEQREVTESVCKHNIVPLINVLWWYYWFLHPSIMQTINQNLFKLERCMPSYESIDRKPAILATSTPRRYKKKHGGIIQRSIWPPPQIRSPESSKIYTNHVEK